MGRGDWRTSAAYEDLRSLDAPGFAWEYLDRNPEFAQERRKLERADRRNSLTQAEVDAFTRRWGVRFREYDGSEQPQSTPLVPTRSTKRDRSDGTAG
jgi:hypothetical protein